MRRAAQLARQADLHVGIAVLDVQTGDEVTAGSHSDGFATASVVKVMIAARLLVQGPTSPERRALMYTMITRSDDDIANSLWGVAGGSGLEPWIETHYHLPGLGSANEIPGRWGNTHVSALGLVRLYAALVHDPKVWPFLGNAMHHAKPVAADGTHQKFGLFAAWPGAAIKQGWAAYSTDVSGDAVVNSTGLIAHDRYAVAILTEGRGNVGGCDDEGFNAEQAHPVTEAAELIARAVRGR